MNTAIKCISLLTALILCAALVCACGGNNGAGQQALSAQTADAACEPAETQTPLPAETTAPETTFAPGQYLYDGIIPRDARGFVYDPDGGLLYLTDDETPLLYALEGENTDAIFGESDYTLYNIEGMDEPVSFLTLSDPPVLLGEATQAMFFCGARSEYKYDGEYWSCLLYIDAFTNALVLRGSNPNRMFGDFESAPEPVEIFENAAGIGRDDTHVCVVDTEGNLFVWDVNKPTGDGAPVLYAENVDPNWLLGSRAYLFADGRFEFDTLPDPADRGNNVAESKNTAAFVGAETSALVLSQSGRLTYLFLNEAGEYSVRDVAEAVSDFGMDKCSAYIWYVDTNGGLYTLNEPWEFDSQPRCIFSPAAEAGVCGNKAWAVDKNGALYFGAADVQLSKIADDVVRCVGAMDGCVYATKDCKLHSYKYALPEGTEGDVYDIDLSKSLMAPFSTVYDQGDMSYIEASRAILAGESVEEHYFPEYKQFVFFNEEEDGLKVYSTMTTTVYHVSHVETEVKRSYSGLIATLPKELAKRANESMHGFADRCFLSSIYSADADFVSIGLYGGDWVAFTTEDDSLQDLACLALFCRDGDEWREIPACPGVMIDENSSPVPHTISGAYAKGDTAYICYSTKFLWSEQTGWRYPYICRTTDGGETWQRLDIELPEAFAADVPWVGILSPVFEGDRGVMILSRGYNERLAWLETNDGGDTWEFKTLP